MDKFPGSIGVCIDDRRYRKSSWLGRLMFWLLAPAFAEYRRRNTLVVRPDGTYFYAGTSEKDSKRLTRSLFGNRKG